MLKITLKEYLAKLERIHGDSVPTLSEIGVAIGTTQASISRISRNKMKLLNRKTIADIVIYLREKGYKTALDDILILEE